MKILHKIFILISFSLIAIACDDLLETSLPSNQIGQDDAIKTAEDLQQLLNAAYDVMANGFNGNHQRFAELLSDNVHVDGNTGFLVQVYNRSSDFFNSDVGGYFKEPYTAILRANEVLERMGDVELSEAEKNRFEGEAKFIRAICHFELVRLFGQPFGYTPDNSHLGIVIKTSTEISALQRGTVKEAYDQVLEDLFDAEGLLPETNGVYATTYAAKAYLAKVYFQMNDFSNAAAKAEEVIASPNFSFPSDINSRYTAEISPESIFSLISVSTTNNRGKLFYDMYNSDGANIPTLRVSQEYFSLLKSDGNDLRSTWVDVKPSGTASIQVFTKFNPSFMSVSLTSLTEMMLIAAESYGELNTNLPAAADYINQIKARANVPLISEDPSAGIVIQETRVEKRKEFGGEGLRIHDLKRRAVKGEDVIVRGAPWDCNGMVLQFPASELSIEGFELNPQGGCN